MPHALGLVLLWWFIVLFSWTELTCLIYIYIYYNINKYRSVAISANQPVYNSDQITLNFSSASVHVCNYYIYIYIFRGYLTMINLQID